MMTTRLAALSVTVSLWGRSRAFAGVRHETLPRSRLVAADSPWWDLLRSVPWAHPRGSWGWCLDVYRWLCGFLVRCLYPSPHLPTGAHLPGPLSARLRCDVKAVAQSACNLSLPRRTVRWFRPQAGRDDHPDPNHIRTLPHRVACPPHPRGKRSSTRPPDMVCRHAGVVSRPVRGRPRPLGCHAPRGCSAVR